MGRRIGSRLFAKQRGLDFALFEASTHVGGNCRTLQAGGFRFDTGAHRFHNKDPEVTSEVNQLLGDALLRVEAPSEIFFDGRYVQFPLKLLDLIQKLDAKTLLKVVCDAPGAGRGQPADNFAAFAVNRYGKTLAERFLLNYSQKLWGEMPHKLSTAISGRRFKRIGFQKFYPFNSDRRCSTTMSSGRCIPLSEIWYRHDS